MLNNNNNKNQELTMDSLFEDFDYKKYWSRWEKEHPNQLKEWDCGKPVGKEIL